MNEVERSVPTVAELESLLLENFAPWVHDLGLKVTAGAATHIELRLVPGTRLERQGGLMSGQAMMAAADTAMALLLLAAHGAPCATVDMSTSFLRPAIGSELNVRAEIVRLGRSLAFLRAELTGVDSGKLVATATATYALPPTKPQDSATR